jgi:hypothetical protein
MSGGGQTGNAGSDEPAGALSAGGGLTQALDRALLKIE